MAGGVPDFLLVVDRHGKILFINKSVRGVRLNSVAGTTTFDYLPLKYHGQMQKALKTVFAKGVSVSFEVMGTGPNNTVSWYYTRMGPIKKRGKVVACVQIARDITKTKEIEREILEIGGRVQREIGQDLHDSLSQHLTGIAFLSKGLEQKLLNLNLKEAGQATQIVHLVNQSIEHTRRLARGLHLVELENNGIIAALDELTANLRNIYQIACRFRYDKTVRINDITVATHVFRIAQEALTNAVRHGKATSIDMTLTTKRGEHTLSIADNGHWIAHHPNHQGMGLNIMQYRSQLIEATLDIKKKSPAGTRVVLHFSA